MADAISVQIDRSRVAGHEADSFRLNPGLFEFHGVSAVFGIPVVVDYALPVGTVELWKGECVLASIMVQV